MYQPKDILSTTTSTDKHEEGSNFLLDYFVCLQYNIIFLAAKLTCTATPMPVNFSHLEVFLDMEKTLRIQKLKESIEHQKVLQNLKVEAAIAERNAKKYEEEYWKKKLESL